MMHTTLEIVGLKEGVRVIDPDKFMLLIERFLAASAKTCHREIQNRLGQVEFKHSKGRIQRALRYEVGDDWSAVFMDERIAPHARHVEHGVKPHTMRYLLKATRPIPVGVGNVTLFRWATEKWMGTPHPMVDPTSGLVFMTKGWQHPGYAGKYYFRDGTLAAMEIVKSKGTRFILRATIEQDTGLIPEVL